MTEMSEPSRRLADAFDGLLDELRSAAERVRAHPFYADEANRAGGYAFLVHLLLSRLEEEVIHDAAFPTFRVLDPRTREGADNPDQRYLISRIDGGETYRIWGRMGAERRVELQIYAGAPYDFGSGGRSAGFLAHEDLVVAPDGTFEVIASPEPRPGNWIENPADATRILVRQVYGAWTDAGMGEIHIDRMGHEGDLRPRLEPAELADRLATAAREVGRHVDIWPEMVRNLNVEAMPPNTIGVPMDPGASGGVAGRFMAFGHWELGDDDALVITTWPASGNYQGIQLADLWWSSLEYANRQTSLTGDQARPGSDGSFTFVVAHRDPGVANWLDTTGLPRGSIVLRFDGTIETAFDPQERPVARLVRWDELDEVLGPDVPRVTAAERQSDIAARRRHVQVRFGT
ncbi:MAG: hypothetical protein R2707_17725 [Acidimicrobiales bacterium]